jgi:hypothetical protein
MLSDLKEGDTVYVTDLTRIIDAVDYEKASLRKRRSGLVVGT